MITKLTLFFTNWKTSVPAILALVCASDSMYFKLLPPEWEAKAGALCTFLVAMGLLAAKDADKTNSGTAGPARTVSAKLPTILLAGFLTTGCAGTMLDGKVCTVATNANTQRHVETLVNSYVDLDEQYRAARYLKGAKLGATALCEMVRSREAVPELPR